MTSTSIHYEAGDRSSVTSSHNLNLTQQQINAALFNSNSPLYSVQPMAASGCTSDKHYQNQDLHMAEILVESAANGQQRSAFQFDTITPKKNINPTKTTPNATTATDYDDAPLSSAMMDSGIEIPTSSSAADEITKDFNKTNNSSSSKEDLSTKSSSESDDNGGFVTPEESQRPQKSQHRVKRATVVGNPMFSTSQEEEEVAGEDGGMAATEGSLGIDDLDYDDIMHYFDNLKVNRR